MLKALALRRICGSGAAPTLCRRLGTTSTLNVPPKHVRIWSPPSSSPFDDTFFNMASRLMRNLEREFDMISRQIDNNGGRFSRTWPFPKAIESVLENDLVVTDKDGNRKFQLVLGLGDFKPEEIKVKTEGKSLHISAKKETKESDQYYLREFNQTYSLPEELKLEDLKSKWTDGGYLIIDAPLPKQIESQPKVKEIPIEHEKK